MSSEEHLLAFLKSAGFQVQEFDKWPDDLWEHKELIHKVERRIDVQYVFSSGNNGYTGFFAAFVFDKEGNFIEHYCGE